MTLHASITPKGIAVGKGQQLTVALDSNGADINVGEVLITVQEVAPRDSFEKGGKAPKFLVSFYGKIVNKVFQTLPTKDGSPSIKFPKWNPDDPAIEIVIDSITVTVNLPDADREHGVFEVGLEVQTLAPRRKLFRSKSPSFVRSFRHFMVNKIARPVVAFIALKPGDGFYAPAMAYWKDHADAVLAKFPLSLKEMLNILEKEKDKYGGYWGQINIVCHGRAHQLQLKGHPKWPTDFMHADQVEELLAYVPLSNGGVDDQTEIVFRSCNAGRDQQLVDQLRAQVFPEAKFVKIPKFIQRYRRFPGRTETVESFLEEITFDVKGHSAPTDAMIIQAGKLKAFKELRKRSPGLSPSAKYEDEIATFLRKEKRDFKQTYKDHVNANENAMVDADLKSLSNAELVKVCRNRWTKESLHTKSATWRTHHDRWDITVVSKKHTGNAPAIWFQVDSTTKPLPSPKFKMQGSGLEELGSGSEKGLWTVSGQGIEPKHVRIEIVKLTTIKVTALATATTKVVAGGKSQSLPNDGDSATATLPCVVEFGSAKLEVRRAKQYQIDFEAKRYFPTWRRIMLTYDAAKKHLDRAPLTPELSKSKHFGTSS